MPAAPSSVIRPAVLVVAASAVFAPLVTPGGAEGRAYPTGAPAGYAGDRLFADGTPVTCTTCHRSFALGEGPGGVALRAPAQAAPGETVEITVEVDNQTGEGGARRQGFQAAVKDPSVGPEGAHVGALGVGEGGDVRFAQGNAAYVTHTGARPEQTAWTFTWTAPPAGEAPASVRVYVTGNAADGDGGRNGDRVFAATADISLAATSAAPDPSVEALRLGPPRPNPARDLARLDLRLAAPGRVSVRVVDGVGRTVRLVASGERAAGPYTLTVPTAGLAAGTYFVVADGPGGRRAQPLVVAR